MNQRIPGLPDEALRPRTRRVRQRLVKRAVLAQVVHDLERLARALRRMTDAEVNESIVQAVELQHRLRSFTTRAADVDMTLHADEIRASHNVGRAQMEPASPPQDTGGYS